MKPAKPRCSLANFIPSVTDSETIKESGWREQGIAVIDPWGVIGIEGEKVYFRGPGGEIILLGKRGLPETIERVRNIVNRSCQQVLRMVRDEAMLEP